MSLPPPTSASPPFPFPPPRWDPVGTGVTGHTRTYLFLFKAQATRRAVFSSPWKPPPTPSLHPQGPRAWERRVMRGGWKSQFCGAPRWPVLTGGWQSFQRPAVWGGLGRSAGAASSLEEAGLTPGRERRPPRPLHRPRGRQGTKSTGPHHTCGRTGCQGHLRPWSKEGQGRQGRGGLGSWGPVGRPEPRSCPLSLGES